MPSCVRSVRLHVADIYVTLEKCHSYGTRRAVGDRFGAVDMKLSGRRRIMWKRVRLDLSQSM